MLDNSPGPIAIGAGGRDQLSYRIDSFLEAARRTQNAVIPYLSKALSISLPASLADLVKRIEKEKVLLPENIAKDILGYWTNQGRKLKDYRDLSQHHALVASEVRVFKASVGKPAIYIALPKNPEAKDPNKLDFDDPPVQAYYYLKEQLRWLIRFCHVVTTALTVPPSGPSRSVSASIVFRNSLKMGAGAQLVGHTIFTDEEIRKDINEYVTSLGRL